MKLFSKRYKNNRLDRSYFTRDSMPRYSRSGLVSQEVRNRIISELRYITSNDDYLEWFILFDNQRKEKKFLDKDKVDSFSLAELGYKISEIFIFEDFAMLSRTETMSDSKDLEVFEDQKLFDLIEIIILFAKKDKRSEVVDRMNIILLEESTDYVIQDNFVIKKQIEDFLSILPTIKDIELKNKLELYFTFYEKSDYVNAAKISADIINIIFSDYYQDSKKAKIDEMLTALSKKILGVNNVNEVEKKNVKDLSSILNDLLKNSKNLINNIYDIRHSEKHTIKPVSKLIYKSIANHNMSIIELAILSTKEDYILGDNWEKIKSDYIKKYGINPHTRLTIKKPEEKTLEDNYLDIDDIPF